MSLSHQSQRTHCVTTRARRSPRVAYPVSEALEGRRLLTAVVVNTTVDSLFPSGSGLVSLRNAIADADASSSPTTVTFDSKVFATRQTITMNGIALEMSNTSEPTVITGPAAGVILDAGGKSSVLNVDGGVNASISGLTATRGSGGAVHNGGTLVFTNGAITNSSASPNGGGLYNGGNATLVNATVSGNTAIFGGGILDDGTITLTDVTLSANTATGEPQVYGSSGAGIYVNGSATLVNVTASANIGAEGDGVYVYAIGKATLTNVTIANNVGGTGLQNIGNAANLTIVNSIVAGNNANASDASGAFNSLGHNLIGVTNGSAGWNTLDRIGTAAQPLNAHLASLANNGGPTQTMLPLSGSPVIDHGSNAFVPSGITTDQRGLARIYNGTVDIGAVEVQPTAPVILIKLAGLANQSATRAVPATVKLGSFTQSGATGPFKVDVKWGDGTADTLLTVTSAGTIPSTTHTFATVGSFTVSETVTDSKGHLSNKGTFVETVVAPTTGTVGGQVFVDTNGDGKLDGTESGMAGALVYVDANNDGQFEPGEQYVIADAKGDFTFTLKAATYLIRVQVRSGFYETAPLTFGDKVTVTAGGKVAGVLFGERPIPAAGAPDFPPGDRDGPRWEVEVGRERRR